VSQVEIKKEEDGINLSPLPLSSQPASASVESSPLATPSAAPPITIKIDAVEWVDITQRVTDEGDKIIRKWPASLSPNKTMDLTDLERHLDDICDNEDQYVRDCIKE